MAANTQLKCNIPETGDIYTSDMVTGEPVRYGKVRRFGLEPLAKIEFFTQKEELAQSWRFTGQTEYNTQTAEADYSPAPKEFSGEYYPVRYLAAVITTTGGEVISGHLYSTVAYLDTGTEVIKIPLLAKDRGLPGQSLDELVYVQCIKFTDQGKVAPASVSFSLANMQLIPSDKCYALTLESLVTLPSKADLATNAITVESSLGEHVMLALCRADKYIVGWPKAGGNDELSQIAGDHLTKMRDFYNERKLLGVWLDAEKEQLLTLVSLRRRFAESNFGEIGGEWDKASGKIVEPWRLSVWRWRYDKTNKQLTLIGRGSFQRLILDPADETPEVEIKENLWILPGK